MAQQIRRVDPLSAAKVGGVLYALMGLLFIPFMLIIRSVAPAEPGVPNLGMWFAVLMPILYGALGFVFTLISAALYNLIAGWVGGIEIELG